MKMAMKVLLVGIAFTTAVHCSSGESFSREFCGNESSFSSRQSLGNTGSFVSDRSSITSRCIICTLLCTSSAQENDDCVELAELCYFCTHSRDVEGGKRFVCGHIYAENSCVKTASEDIPCPSCRMYHAVRAGDLSMVQELLMLCAPQLYRIVFPHGRERRSLINVCMDTDHLVEAMNILLALLVKNLMNPRSKHFIPVGELAHIVLRACPQTTTWRWQSLRLVMVSLAQCTDSNAAKFFCSCLEKIDFFRQVVGWYEALESTLSAEIPGLSTPPRRSLHPGC